MRARFPLDAPRILSLDSGTTHEYSHIMNEYLIYANKGSEEELNDNWRAKIKKHRGVSAKPTCTRGMVIKCSDKTIEKLRKKFPHLKIQYILPHFAEVEGEENKA